MKMSTIPIGEHTDGHEEGCTVSFDPGNGEGEWFITVPKGRRASRPADPKMSGRTFAGWTDGSGNVWLFGNAVTEDINLKGKWADAAERVNNSENASASQAIMACFALVAILISMPKVTGTVSRNGKALGNIEVTYRINGTSEWVTTDEYGRFVIPVSIGSTFEVLSVNGRSPMSAPSVTVQKRVTEMNFRI